MSDEYKEEKQGMKIAGGVIVLAMAAQLIFWLALAGGVFWLVKHFFL